MYEKLLIWQYRHKPKAQANARLISNLCAEYQDVLARFPLLFNIDKAEGYHLDVIGRIVGVSRVVRGYTYLRHFAFTRYPLAQGFSFKGQGGGRWYRYGYPVADDAYLEDGEFRWLIWSKVWRNAQRGNLSYLCSALNALIGKNVSVTDNYDMTINIDIDKSMITDFQKYALEKLDILPRPQGVKHIIKIAGVAPPEKGDGRNHVLDSDITTSSVRQTLSFSDEFKANSRGKWITLSCDISFSPVSGSKEPNRMGIEMAIAYEDGETQGIICGLQDTDKVTEAVNKRFINTAKIKDKPIKRIYGCWLRNQTANSDATIGRPKVEYGQVATEWTRAPEDFERLPIELQDCPKINRFGQITLVSNDKPLYVCYKSAAYVKDVNGTIQSVSTKDYDSGLFRSDKNKCCYATIEYIKAHQSEFNKLNSNTVLDTENSIEKPKPPKPIDELENLPVKLKDCPKINKFGQIERAKNNKPLYVCYKTYFYGDKFKDVDGDIPDVTLSDYNKGLFRNETSKRCYVTIEYVKAHQSEFNKLNSNVALNTENSIEKPKPPKPIDELENLPVELRSCPKINKFGQITLVKNGKPLYVCYKLGFYVKDVDGNVSNVKASDYSKGLFRNEISKRCYVTVEYVKAHQSEFNKLNSNTVLDTENSIEKPKPPKPKPEDLSNLPVELRSCPHISKKGNVKRKSNNVIYIVAYAKELLWGGYEVRDHNGKVYGAYYIDYTKNFFTSTDNHCDYVSIDYVKAHASEFESTANKPKLEIDTKATEWTEAPEDGNN